MTQAQLDLLRRMATQAQQADMDVGLGANVVLALVNEIEAARWSRMRAEAEVEALRLSLDGTTRMMAERFDNSARGYQWMRDIVAANQEVLADHPIGGGGGDRWDVEVT